MTIIRDNRYIKNLQNMLDNIANDSITRANKFRINLDKKIDNLPNMLFKFRQSNYYEDENIIRLANLFLYIKIRLEDIISSFNQNPF